MSEDLDRLLDALDLEQLDTCLFRGTTPQSRNPRVYGGQVLSQALSCADRSVAAGLRAHSLHAYFLRPGDPSRPIIYEVDPIREGRRFSTRVVVARQQGKAIFNASLSYQRPESGLEHQVPMMQEVPPPESLPRHYDFSSVTSQELSAREPVRSWNPIEYRPLIPRWNGPMEAHPPHTGVWMRADGTLGDDPALHAQVLAYMSDSFLMAISLLPHGMGFDHPHVETASIDHALWFYGDFRVDDWMFYELRSPRSGGGRGFNLGSIYARDGRLVATTAQEGLMHLRSSSGAVAQASGRRHK
ncbi:MAG TPA: acyl-CoA thioesterase II [Pseudomonadales bacterium]|nr:acyl-CoA thioesterase II [Pseudomonadales bacterium]HNC69729.1 acyl-CoA thioesterase II [Pseudomonadales bacterium]